MPDEPSTVSGTVRRTDDTPAPGLLVVAYDQDLSSQTMLGAATTDNKGRYMIRYEPVAAEDHEYGSADLLVRVMTEDGEQLGISEIIVNVDDNVTVDLQVPIKNFSLFERIMLKVEPILGDTRPSTLREDAGRDDIGFLARETGLSRDLLRRFAMAHRLEEYASPAGLWFGLLNGQCFDQAGAAPLSEATDAVCRCLARIDPLRVKKALALSAFRNVIPSVPQKAALAWIESFKRLHERLQDDQPLEHRPVIS
ncbi:carboxypeptidase-like regulatory domain-containing protein [Candidatus Bipolaricaulota bacterium]